MSYYATPEGKDPQLWHTARKRASFKSHLIIYLIVNAGLWLIWYFTGASTYGNTIPWPAWNTFGWGIGLLAHYVSVYSSTGINSVEKEYNKLAQKQFK
ncbi:MAG TPA: 2TM domain-containing protein [Flavisolibacter sp.]|jgi:cytochrome c oxidase assembly factor CtaG